MARWRNGWSSQSSYKVLRRSSPAASISGVMGESNRVEIQAISANAF